ncbi:MAG: MC/SLC25 family protein [bacterium]
MLQKFVAGSLAGAIGSVAGNPFDVLKTRMMATEGKGNASFSHHSQEIFNH